MPCGRGQLLMSLGPRLSIVGGSDIWVEALVSRLQSLNSVSPVALEEGRGPAGFQVGALTAEDHTNATQSPDMD